MFKRILDLLRLNRGGMLRIERKGFVLPTAEQLEWRARRLRDARETRRGR